MVSNQDIVINIYNGILFRTPTNDEIETWSHELDIGNATPSGLYLHAAESDSFLQQNLPLAQVFYSLMGRHMNANEMLTWGSTLRSGASTDQIILQFIQSVEYQNRTSELNGLTEHLNFLYEAITGEAADTTLIDTWVENYSNQTLSLTGLALELAANKDIIEIGLGLVYTTLTGTQATDELITPYSSNDSYRDAVAQIYQDFISLEETEVEAEPTVEDPTTEDTSSLQEIDGQLTLGNQDFDGMLEINLAQQTINDASMDYTLSSGSLANVNVIDGRMLVDSNLMVTGDNDNETVYGSDNGDTFSLASGNNTLYLGDSADTIVLEATPSGQDTLYYFARGTDGDLLDVSAFLDIPNLNSAGTVTSDSSDAITWSNGDILIVSGFGLETTNAIAGLFGDGQAFANPSSAGKAIVISADIIGDASIWTIINQTNTTTIEDAEVTLIGTLKEVNNLELLGFDSANFIA